MALCDCDGPGRPPHASLLLGDRGLRVICSASRVAVRILCLACEELPLAPATASRAAVWEEVLLA